MLKLYNNNILNREINRIITADVTSKAVYFGLIVHGGDEDFHIRKILGMDVMSDYLGAQCDLIELSVQVSIKDYEHVFRKYRNDLQCTLVLNYGKKKYTTRYKVLISQEPEVAKDTSSEGDMLVTIDLQLISLIYFRLKDRITHGVITDAMTLDKIFSYYIHTELSNIKINGKPVDPYIDVSPIHNKRKYDNLILPDVINIIDYPIYFQRLYGVYNGGIGTYLYRDTDNKDIVSIYSIYNPDNLPHKRNMEIYIPTDRRTGIAIEDTAILENDTLKIIGLSDINVLGRSDSTSDTDNGIGYAILNANVVMSRYTSRDRGGLYADFRYCMDIEKDDQYTKDSIVQMYSASDNNYMLRSKRLEEKSYMISVTWQYSRPDWLIPGMGITIIIEEDNEPKKYRGVLASAHSEFRLNKFGNDGVVSTRLNVIITK